MVTGINNERETARLVAVRGQTTRPRVRRRSPVVCRCRPGEVATWVRLDLTAGQADELRDAASRAGVSVDAWLAVMVEFTTALPILDDAVGPADCARNRLALVLKSPVMIAALPRWRTWQVYLARHTASGPDELPEVVLPERLLARCNGDVQFESALAAASDWPLARSCEVAACGRGRSLEAFMLQAALA